MPKEIQLTRGKVTLVDDEDYALLLRHRWQAIPSQDTFYASCSLGTAHGKQHKVLMHRFLMQPAKGMEIDHINGNGLDNRRSNLRVVTRRENLQNRRGWGKYGKWVSFNKRKQKFMVHFSCWFETQEEAQAVADKLARLTYGEHANTGHMTNPESVIPELPIINNPQMALI